MRTDIQTYRHTDIQTDRHTCIHTYIHIYIFTYLHMFRDSGVFPHIFLLDQVTLTFKVYGTLFDIVATCCNADDSQFFVPAIDLVNLDQWVMWKLGGFMRLSQDTLIRLILYHSCKTSDKPSLTTTVSPRCIVNTKIVMNNNKYAQNSFVFWHRNYRHLKFQFPVIYFWNLGILRATRKFECLWLLAAKMMQQISHFLTGRPSSTAGPGIFSSALWSSVLD